MFEKIDFYIRDKKIEVCGVEFLLGKLSSDIMNIPPDEFSEMVELVDAIETDKGKQAMQKLHGLLMKRELFKLASKNDFLGSANQYRQIVSDIYSFNQTMFYFVDKFIMRLHKLDLGNYAAALSDFYTHQGIHKMMVNHFRDGLHSFNWFDEIEVKYLPREIPGKPDNYAIYEIYSVQYLQGFLKIDFMKALMAGHAIRRCLNCKRFFLSTDFYKTAYCDRPLPDKPHRNCRNQGAKNIAKEKAANTQCFAISVIRFVSRTLRLRLIIVSFIWATDGHKGGNFDFYHFLRVLRPY